jgi:hypothetical protein
MAVVTVSIAKEDRQSKRIRKQKKKRKEERELNDNIRI